VKRDLIVKKIEILRMIERKQMEITKEIECRKIEGLSETEYTLKRI